MILERAVLTAPGESIGAEAVAVPPDGAARPAAPALTLHQGVAAPAAAEWPTLAEVEREHIRKTLELVSGNRWAAARLLQLDWRRFQQRLHWHDLVAGGLPSRRPPQMWPSRAERKAA